MSLLWTCLESCFVHSRDIPCGCPGVAPLNLQVYLPLLLETASPSRLNNPNGTLVTYLRKRN